MVQSLLPLLVASLLAPSGSAAPQEPAKPPLPHPFRFGNEAERAGNPLAAFVEMLNRQKEYVADESMRSAYWQARSTVAANLGDIVDANRSWDAAFARGRHPILLKSPCKAMRPQNAVDVIVRAADRHSWIMLGEEHVKPQTRSIMIPLLRALRKKGFRTLAVETLNDDMVAPTQRRGYADVATGTYTADPVFAAGIREALSLGYRLVPYEAIERPKDVPAGDPHYAQNFRESGQARNLKERIYDRDPKAKVVVWAGRAHVYEQTDKDASGEWRPMAYEFKRMTGIDPFSVYLATYTEAGDRSSEWPLYKWATDRGLVRQPTIFVAKNGTLYGSSFDAQVFFPRTTYVFGRPDWLMRELGRKSVEIPAGLVKPKGIQLVQAFRAGEPVTAIPVDQIVIRPGDPVPALMLPPRGTFMVRAIDEAGKATPPVGVRTR